MLPFSTMHIVTAALRTAAVLQQLGRCAAYVSSSGKVSKPLQRFESIGRGQSRKEAEASFRWPKPSAAGRAYARTVLINSRTERSNSSCRKNTFTTVPASRITQSLNGSAVMPYTEIGPFWDTPELWGLSERNGRGKVDIEVSTDIRESLKTPLPPLPENPHRICDRTGSQDLLPFAIQKECGAVIQYMRLRIPRRL